MRCSFYWTILVFSTDARLLGADAFDFYINPILDKVPEAKGVKELKQLTPDLLSEYDQVLPEITGTFIVVRTNEGRYSKLLVQSARRKIGADTVLPILLIDRYVTYREGEEQRIQASGQNLNLFNGFRLNLDIGQVVPAEVGCDLRFVAEEGKTYLEPRGKARLYLVTQPLPEATKKKAAKVAIGDTFLPTYFTGTYKLHDDGRRSGTLKLEVDAEGNVSGGYYSDTDGQKYEVSGRVGHPRHGIIFIVKFPQTEQTYQGWMFTGNGQAITGSSRLHTRETGFYAVRVRE